MTGKLNPAEPPNPPKRKYPNAVETPAIEEANMSYILEGYPTADYDVACGVSGCENKGVVLRVTGAAVDPVFTCGVCNHRILTHVTKIEVPTGEVTS